MPLFNIKELKRPVTNTQNKITELFKDRIFNKCILIGSNISVKSGLYGDYIDNAEDALVVRINRDPVEEYYKYYGKRSDLIMGWESRMLGIPNGIRVPISTYNKQVNDYLNTKLRCTTGLGCLFILGNIYDEIELFGFGFTESKFKDNLFHYIDGSIYRGPHAINKEDIQLKKLQETFKGKIYRGEEKHTELWV